MARYYEETALIEFVKERTPTINGETTMECVERAIRDAPTADVVPKSEVEKIFEEIEAELKLALDSNYKAKRKHIDKKYYCLHAEFLASVQGKIDALRGIDDFIAEFKKKYTKEE